MVIVRLIEAYLTRRVSRVHVSGELLGTIPVCNVVRQGPMIDPPWFLQFLNDLPKALEALMMLYADDVKIVTFRAQKSSFKGSILTVWDGEMEPVPTSQLGEKFPRDSLSPDGSSTPYLWPNWSKILGLT